MNLLEVKNSYFARRISALVVLYIFGLIAAYISGSQAVIHLQDFFSASSGSFAPTLSIIAATLIEVGKGLFITLLFIEIFKLKYADLILLMMSIIFVALSVFTSRQGLEITKARELQEQMEQDSSSAPSLSPLANIELKQSEVKANMTASQRRHAYKSNQANAEAVKAAANIAETALQLEKLRQQKQKEQSAALEGRKESKFLYLISVEISIILVNLATGYIWSRKDEEEQLEELSEEEKNKLKQRFISARAKALKGNQAAIKNMKKLEAELKKHSIDIPKQSKP